VNKDSLFFFSSDAYDDVLEKVLSLLSDNK